MAKKLDISTLLTKISSVFKNDAYIIMNRYCVGGMESEEKLYTQILLEMSPEASKILKELFPDNNYVYITDMKDAKADLMKAVNFRVYQRDQKDLQKRIDEVLKYVNMTEKWKNFNFSKEDAEYVFTDGYSIEIFGEGTDYPPVTIAKPLFPLMTAKRLPELYYQIYMPDDGEELVSIITQLDMGHYKVYNLIQYVDVDSDLNDFDE